MSQKSSRTTVRVLVSKELHAMLEKEAGSRGLTVPLLAEFAVKRLLRAIRRRGHGDAAVRADPVAREDCEALAELSASRKHGTHLYELGCRCEICVTARQVEWRNRHRNDPAAPVQRQSLAEFDRYMKSLEKKP